jgi:hypothetical protein
VFVERIHRACCMATVGSPTKTVLFDGDDPEVVDVNLASPSQSSVPRRTPEPRQEVHSAPSRTIRRDLIGNLGSYRCHMKERRRLT